MRHPRFVEIVPVYYICIHLMNILNTRLNKIVSPEVTTLLSYDVCTKSMNIFRSSLSRKERLTSKITYVKRSVRTGRQRNGVT
jgi:hypothetical protein